MEAKNVIVTIVLCLLMLGAGVGGGIFWQAQKTPVTVVTAPAGTTTTTGGTQQVLPPSIKDLGSKLIPSITANGTVSKIAGKNLTVTKDGDSMTIAIRDDAKIYSFTTPAPGSKTPPVSKQITFADIKNGNNVSVSLKVLPTGLIEGTSVIVLPATVK